jgi:predicted transcriptional regulator
LYSMVRFISIIPLLSSFFFGHKQVAPNRLAKKSDTTFLLREVTKDDYHAVYIDHNRQSAAYKRLLNFNLNKYDVNDYRENYRIMKSRHHAPLKKFNLAGLLKQWMPLYLHKGKYYIYSPSEWGTIDRRILTDSTMMYWFMDGLTPEPYQQVKKINNHTYAFKLHSFYTDNPGNTTIIIHIIDPKNQIAIWEDTGEKGASHYGLYIPRQNARNFDLIVNSCLTEKTNEFEFDKVDYAKLLKGL